MASVYEGRGEKVLPTPDSSLLNAHCQNQWIALHSLWSQEHQGKYDIMQNLRMYKVLSHDEKNRNVKCYTL